VARCAPAPVVPEVTTNRSLEDLQNAFSEQIDSIALGMMLYVTQSKQGDLDGALATLRTLEKIPTCPKYVYYLEANRGPRNSSGSWPGPPGGIITARMTMKILQVIHSVNPQAGGTTEAVRQFSRRPGPARHQIEVLTLDAADAPWNRDFPLPLFALGPGRPGYGYAPGWCRG